MLQKQILILENKAVLTFKSGFSLGKFRTFVLYLSHAGVLAGQHQFVLTRAFLQMLEGLKEIGAFLVILSQYCVETVNMWNENEEQNGNTG